ncbi:MAG: hypothetical protein R2873_08540 [Caldilineaceae bacterium]
MAHHGWWRYISHDPTQNRPQITRSLLGRVAHYAKPYWRSLLLVLTLILLTSLLELVPPVLYGTVIDLLYGNLTNQTLPRKTPTAHGFVNYCPTTAVCSSTYWRRSC